jgi:2-polyprenyl-3-methyl-5-hydroxy-6-metoxy-1,4-benzoquinol methylase
MSIRRTPHIKNGEKELAYREKIKGEAHFWDERAEALLSSGRIPLWFNHRRGEDVTFIPLRVLRGAGIRANPILYRIVFGDMIDLILKEVTQKKGYVLDLGCGAGWFSLELARNGMDVDGFDISPKQIEIAKIFSAESQQSPDPLLHGNFGSTNYQVIDLNRVTLKEQKYEAVVSFGALHHIQRLNHLVEEVHESLKPKGKFIFYEYVGYSGLSKIIPILFKLIGSLPKFIRWMARSTPPLKSSPFDGVSKQEILEMVKKRFLILRVEFKFLFLLDTISRLGIYRLPHLLCIPLLKMIYFMDNTLIDLGIFKGPYAFVIAQKN